MCNNKETFEAEMKLFGVYIPEQDASWEREGTIHILRKHNLGLFFYPLLPYVRERT